MSLALKLAQSWSVRINRAFWHPTLPSYQYSQRFRGNILELSLSHQAFSSLPKQQPTQQNPDSFDFPPSKFVRYLVVSEDDAPVSVVRAIQGALGESLTFWSTEEIRIPQDPKALLSPWQLLHIGAVHFLPAGASHDRSKGVKAARLAFENATQMLQAGDYLRIHHDPRRFPAVYAYDWEAFVSHSVISSESAPRSSTTTTSTQVKPGVLVAVDEDKGFIVISKPASVPVHPTVDNILENVPHFIRQSKIKKTRLAGREVLEEDLYVASPQRLDQNTSGLMVVATKKVFAAYFAKLLRDQTDQQLAQPDGNHRTVRKKYRCLVALMQPSNGKEAAANNRFIDDGKPWSIEQATKRIKQMVETQTILRHFLEPSIRAPKRFALSPGNESWAECLLRITKAGEVYRLVGDPMSRQLALKLWGEIERVPPDCVAVVELEVDLLTGRTHQIRGQLSTEGFPLVGDAQYGGSVPSLAGKCSHVSPSTHHMAADRLALQCCELAFIDPDIKDRPDGSREGVQSGRWNSFTLDEAWWSSILSQYRVALTSEPQGDRARSGSDSIFKEARVELLPPKLQLALGKNKYVLVKAVSPQRGCNEPESPDVHWFVKSAPANKCGGPYHADVARDLVERIEVAGFKALVAGGGRIEYTDSPKPRALVYGFSYGFGKGGHAKAAAIIQAESRNTIEVTFDNSNDIY